MLRAIAVIAAALPLLAPVLGQPDPPSDPPADPVRVELMTVNGSGCPNGSVMAAVAPDNAQLAVMHSVFIAELNPTAPPTALRKNAFSFPDCWDDPPSAYRPTLRRCWGGRLAKPGSIGRPKVHWPICIHCLTSKRSARFSDATRGARPLRGQGNRVPIRVVAGELSGPGPGGSVNTARFPPGPNEGNESPPRRQAGIAHPFRVNGHS
jgi:hypothetical protein